ncbi:MAG: YfhO family protein [Bacteroidetes bacterium]|nr:YfhO family protein [Bacteroidota bacterium]
MEKLKRSLPHFIAIGLFIVISFVYFSPVLSGKKVEMYDMSNTKGMRKEVEDFHKKTGVDALWTGSMFAGMPAFQIATFSKENFMTQFFSFMRTIFPEPIDLLLLNLIGFYILLITLKVDYRLAMVGAVMYAFCSYTFIYIKVGHITKTLAIGCMPIVLAGIIRTLKGNLLSGFVLSVLGLWMEIYSNHFQITYYLVYIVAIFLVIELVNAIRTKTISQYAKACFVLMAAATLAVIPNFTNLWSTYIYGKQTTRGASELSAKQASSGLDLDYATDGLSYGVSETLTLLIPEAYGGSPYTELSKSSATYQALTANGVGGAQAASFIKNAPMYWGDLAYAAGPDYIGAITVFLFILGLFIVKGDLKWWLLLATALSIMLAWGKNFMGFTEFFFYHVPGYNKFRSVSMILAIATFAIPVLAILAVKQILEVKNNLEEIKKKLKFAFYITGGLCLLLVLVPGLAGSFEGKNDAQFKQYEWLVNALRDDRESLLRMSALMSLIYISIAFFTLWFFLKKKIKPEYALYILAFFVLVDMWSVDKKYMNNDHFISKNKSDKPFEATNADLQILQDTSLSYRVYNTSVNPFTDAATSYFHKSIGGYHGAKLKRYHELIENQLSKNNMNVLNMLNAKYIIVRPKDVPEPMAQQNPGAMGNAWFVKEIKWVPNADSEMSSLTNFNPAQTAIVDKRFDSDLNSFKFIPDSTASIRLTSYAPNALTYESNTTAKQLAVFSEIYYADGWNAYLDGAKVPYVRTNYVLRGMVVPEGKHKIDFKFEPEYYFKTLSISTAGSVLATLIILGYFVYSFRKKSDAPVA